MPQPLISIIIPTLREGPFIERTLKNFDTLTIPHEIIISDGGSTDETLDIARRYTDKIVVWDQARRQTFGEAKNAGAALAAGVYLAFIDADVIIPEPQAFFEKLIADFTKDARLFAVTVPLKPWLENRSLLDAFFCAPLNWFYIISNNLFHIANASGEFQMMRADTFKVVGGYPEDLAAGEDNEMFRRMGTLGHTRSEGSLCVRHSLRRAHKLGWMRLYAIWIKNGLSVSFRGRAAYKEWAVVR
jgi:glycosyltransferase involved in cell wall biosynthesis